MASAAPAPEKEAGSKKAGAPRQDPADNTMLAQVVGIIIGSPEFQRK
jgi:hypothetical protein